jgi:flagellar hook-length control protein FliK
MPQATQILSPVIKTIPANGAAGVSTETPDSGQSFESALAGHRTADKAPAGEVRTVKNTKPDAPVDAKAPAATDLAASGNLLPLQLPPVPADPVVGTELAGLLAAETAMPVVLAASNLKDAMAATNENTADGLTAAAAAGMQASIQPPVVLPATDGQSFSASVDQSLNRPVVSSVVTRSVAADAQTLAALAAEAATTAPSVKATEMGSSLDVFRAVLKEVAPAVTDARSVPAAMLSASGTQTTSSFTNALSSAPTGAPLPGASINVPFGQAGWGQAFGNQVVWAVNQGMPAAELHLSPPDLGPMSVRISMDQDQASMVFSSSHAMVREAIEAAMPRLRDMLSSQGITLVDVNVSQHGAADTQREPGAFRNASTGAGNESDPGAATGGVSTRATLGMLDIYA